MPKRLTQEEVEEIFRIHGCILKDTYKNVDIKLKFICECGNSDLTSLYEFKKGRRCKQCGLEKRSNKRRHTIEYVKNYFEKEGCKLLDAVYINSHQSLNYRCSCGNIAKTTFANFSKGQRCWNCRNLKIGDKKRTPFEEVFKYFRNQGCELLETEYINCHTLMEYLCSCGNVSKIQFSNFLLGNRCKQCSFKKMSDSKRGEKNPSWNLDREQIKKNKIYRAKTTDILRNCLKRLGKSKEGHTIDVLGYSAKQLQEHIENHPNWERVKDQKWAIDHVFPVVAFTRHNIYDVKLINLLENLQPLLIKENIDKRDKYSEPDFIKYCVKYGVLIEPIQESLSNDNMDLPC